MNKVWRVALYEYLGHVRKKRFIFAFISIPMILIIIFGVIILVNFIEDDHRPVGFVDEAGFLSQPVIMPIKEEDSFTREIEFHQYPDEEAALKALQDKQIQAYFVIEPNYLTSSDVSLVSLENTSDEIRSQFKEILRLNLLAKVDKPVVERLMEGGLFTIQSQDQQKQMDSEQWWKLLLPLGAGILFIIVINTSSGYLLQAIVEEKENRTMEILVTSMTPNQLMGGKIIGNLSVGLTILLIWMAMAFAGLWLVRVLFLPDVQFNLPLSDFLLEGLILIPAFILVAALMAMIGSMVTEEREAQQISGIFTFFMVVPYWFTYQLMIHPNSTLSIIMSIFPLTAPVSLPMRASFTSVPTWQWLVSILLSVGCAIGSIWLAGKAFRLGMLQYGKRLSFKELFKKE